MHIEKVNIYPANMPFRGDFPHSRRNALVAQNLVAEVIADKGRVVGYGEGAPRMYVTGETQEKAVKSAAGLIAEELFPWDLVDVSQIWAFVDRLSGEKSINTAVCCIEMALLDALSKAQGKSMMEYFPGDFCGDKVFYGATVPLASRERVAEVCKIIDGLKIKKLRLKMGVSYEKNREIVQVVKEFFGDHCDLRIDANGAWDFSLAVKHLALIRDYDIKVVEQPLMPGDPKIIDLAKNTDRYGITLMADESACTLREVQKIMDEGFYKMVNVRLSKCGGFRNSLRIIDTLRRSGYAFQIGCQLGESGVLSAAGRILCLLCKDAKYYDGSYDKFLLKENVTEEFVSFGLGGQASALDGLGLGVKVNIDSLKRLSAPFGPVSLRRP